MLLTVLKTYLVTTWVTMLSASSCPKDMLAVYTLSLKTEWSEQKFPKQYPQWRPPAQWSKTVGKLKEILII